MQKFIIILFISFQVSAATAYSHSSETETKTDNSDQILIIYQKAEQYIEDGKFKKSLKLLTALTKRKDLASKGADIYNLLGFNYSKISKPDLDKSYAAFMMALELDPDHIVAHKYLGELYLMHGEKDKALEVLMKLEILVGTSGEEYQELKKAISQL